MTQISKELKDFIGNYIRSVAQLEILLLLHEMREKSWVADEVGRRLGIETEAASTQLMFLSEIGLLRRRDKKPVSFIYSPSEKELKPIIDSLAVAYSKQRVAVFSLILKKPDDRRQCFAEAFKLTRSN
jgi:predicted ArsR family transcriptional regulator